MTSIIKVDQIQNAAGGVPTAADLGLNVSGTVLQVVSNQSTANTSTTSSSMSTVVNGLITPKSASSKILVQVTGTFYKSNNNGGTSGSSHFTVTRDGLALPDYSWTQAGGTAQYTIYTDGSHPNVYLIYNMGFQATDTPSTTSQINYRFRFNANGGVGAVQFYAGTTITLMEIAQ